MYSLITPEGERFDLEPTKYVVDFGIPSGFGLPDVLHTTQTLYNQYGAQLQNINIQPRTVTITGKLNADCRKQLHEIRNRLWQASRWNRTTSDPPDPTTLRYSFNGVERDLNVYYLGDETTPLGSDEKVESIGLRLIAYDPLWYGESNTSPIEVADTLPVSYVVGKIDGIWDNLGNTGTSKPYALVLSRDRTILYIGGTFTNWDGIANADYIAQYDLATATWSALDTGAPDNVWSMVIAQNGDLYIAGGGVGVGFVWRWDGAAWTVIAAAATTNEDVNEIKFDRNGNLYAVGNFTTINGVAANYIAMWNGSVWSALGTGLDADAHSIEIGKDDIVYVGGDFANAGGNPAALIATWNGTTWSALGAGTATGVRISALLFHPNGLLFATGDFTVLSGVSAARIASWNGTAWFPLGAGLAGGIPSAQTLSINEDGNLFVGGAFQTAGTLTLLSGSMAMWNGTAWNNLDISLPPGSFVYSIITNERDIFIAFSTSGNAVVPGTTTMNLDGDVESYPIITITGPGTLGWIENFTADLRMFFDCYINPGETVTIDLVSKAFTSDWRGNMFPFAVTLPQSDFASWSLVPSPIAPGGNNVVTIFMSGTTGASVATIEWTNRYLSADDVS